mmetsp:Transcript_24088/g.46074  ORF Transcript_24088/g.46074 Transcript_24088/m.46074 type:complete len:89 (-) Transcript_24088:102-368(-)
MTPPKLLTDVCHWHPSIAIDEHTGGLLGTTEGSVTANASIRAEVHFYGCLHFLLSLLLTMPCRSQQPASCRQIIRRRCRTVVGAHLNL